ncbi:MAG TPA: hypothetical protein VFK25_08860 [Candidatus Binatia bacterium]|nr:hypothetical protein [Candidatus Binatia bacterium]
MSQPDWAKTYAAMDKRISLKYEQLPRGEQIGKSQPAGNQGRKETLIGWPRGSKLRISDA